MAVRKSYEIEKSLNKQRPTLIKQDDAFYIYGQKEDGKWSLTELSSQALETANLPFPNLLCRDFKSEMLSYNIKYASVYEHIALKHGHINQNKIWLCTPHHTVLAGKAPDDIQNSSGDNSI